MMMPGLFELLRLFFSILVYGAEMLVVNTDALLDHSWTIYKLVYHVRPE